MRRGAEADSDGDAAAGRARRARGRVTRVRRARGLRLRRVVGLRRVAVVEVLSHAVAVRRLATGPAARRRRALAAVGIGGLARVAVDQPGVALVRARRAVAARRAGLGVARVGAPAARRGRRERRLAAVRVGRGVRAVREPGRRSPCTAVAPRAARAVARLRVARRDRRRRSWSPSWSASRSRSCPAESCCSWHSPSRSSCTCRSRRRSPIWQVAPLLCTVSHEAPQALHVAAATAVSQPSVSGGVVSQSAYPELQPVYCTSFRRRTTRPGCCSCRTPCRTRRSWPAVASDVSHPSVSAPLVLQSAQPGWQPAVLADDRARIAWSRRSRRGCGSVSQTLPHAPQLAVDVFELSQPFVFGGALIAVEPVGVAARSRCRWLPAQLASGAVGRVARGAARAAVQDVVDRRLARRLGQRRPGRRRRRSGYPRPRRRCRRSRAGPPSGVIIGWT